MRLLLTLVILLLLGAGIYWYLEERRRNPEIQRAEERISTDAERVATNLRERLSNFSLDTSSIREELSNTGQVIREKTRDLRSDGRSSPDGQISDQIKEKLDQDPQLAQENISVRTSGGVVTLSGTVRSHEQIGQAMLLALETDGVQEVVSKLQVKQSRN